MFHALDREGEALKARLLLAGRFGIAATGKVTGRRWRIRYAAAIIGAVLQLPATALAQHSGSPGRIEPDAGAWRTWVLSSSSQFRLPPPPDGAATRAEVERLRAMVADRDAAARQRIAWWDAAAPSYRWNQIAIEEALRANLNSNVASRQLALLHTAIADGMIAAWDSKYIHNRARPAAADPTLPTAAATPESPSYPDEHAVAGAIAAAILGAVFPQREAEFTRLAEETGRMRLLAGVAFPSDVAAGADLGRRVAAVALVRAGRDGSGQPWSGSVPTTPGLWNGSNPVLPQAAGWTPWLLASPSEIRPVPPAAHNAPERAAEMAALRAFARTAKTNADALFWEYGAGGLRSYQYWNGQLGRLLLEHGQAGNAPRVARTYALFHTAYYDAGVACWDAKYAYWTMRPHQIDREFIPLFAVPSHPSYPSAHSCFSTAAANTLGQFFPSDAATVAAIAREAGQARIWGGLHYQSDVVAGEEIGRRVAERAAQRALGDGADRAAPQPASPHPR